jgi:hypothetical protein
MEARDCYSLMGIIRIRRDLLDSGNVATTTTTYNFINTEGVTGFRATGATGSAQFSEQDSASAEL